MGRHRIELGAVDFRVGRVRVNGQEVDVHRTQGAVEINAALPPQVLVDVAVSECNRIWRDRLARRVVPLAEVTQP